MASRSWGTEVPPTGPAPRGDALTSPYAEASARRAFRRRDAWQLSTNPRVPGAAGCSCVWRGKRVSAYSSALESSGSARPVPERTSSAMKRRTLILIAAETASFLLFPSARFSPASGTSDLRCSSTTMWTSSSLGSAVLSASLGNPLSAPSALSRTSSLIRPILRRDLRWAAFTARTSSSISSSSSSDEMYRATLSGTSPSSLPFLKATLLLRPAGILRFHSGRPNAAPVTLTT